MRWRQIGQISGVILTVIACAFVLREMMTSDFGKLVATRPGTTVRIVSVGIVIYALLDLLLAITWWRLIAMLGPERLQLRTALTIYTVTQSYKYLPSNVLHFVGRHAAAVRQGVSHTALAGAATLEAGGLVAAASVLAALLGPNAVFELIKRVGARQGELVFACAMVVLLGLAGLAMVIWMLRHRGALSLTFTRLLVGGASAMITYAVFFLICGGIVGLLFGMVDGDWSRIDLLSLTGYASLAWVLGFLVPGAPAGVGIRETIFIFTLGEIAGRDTAIVVAALYRLITLGGDLLCAAAGLVASRFVAPMNTLDGPEGAKIR